MECGSSTTTMMAMNALSLWLNSVCSGLERLLVYGPGFSSQGWLGNLGHDRNIAFLGQERGFDSVLYNL